MTIVALRQTIGNQQGLSNFDGSVSAYGDLTPQQQIDMDNAMAQYIVHAPDVFTPAQLTWAQARAGHPISSIQDPAASVGDYASAFGEQALVVGGKVAGIGNGILNLASMATYIIPIAGCAAVAIFLFGFYKKQTR